MEDVYIASGVRTAIDMEGRLRAYRPMCWRPPL